MTVGAAASLTISLKALAEPEDEFIVFSPFFPEYRVFVEGVGAKLVVVESDPKDFQIDKEAFRLAVTPHTKGVIVNSPNNPSGVVLTEECIQGICQVLDDNTLVCYSYSKSLSLPGERIGYIAVSDHIKDWKNVYAAVCGAGRVLGYVCAPSLFQKVIARCQGQVSDVSVYKKNRDILYNALTEYGYRCIKPDGAFYLFVESLEKDAAAFSEKAKEFELLLVPADSFGTPGFVRISYCVSTKQIEDSLPAFKKLAESYGK